MEGLNEGAVSESADSSAAPTPSPSSPLNPQYRSRGNSIASTQQHLAPPGSSSRRFSRNQLGVLSPSGGYAQDPSSSGGRVFSSARNVSSASGTAALAFRRASNMSTRPMSLFAHTGLQSPTADLVSPRGGEQDPFNFTSVAQPAATSGGGGLNPIREGHIASRDASPGAVEAGGPKPASAIWKLPLFLIFQVSSFFSQAVDLDSIRSAGVCGLTCNPFRRCSTSFSRSTIPRTDNSSFPSSTRSSHLTLHR
jgi:hypothetical protein